mgnify:CR=1 FL=1
MPIRLGSWRGIFFGAVVGGIHLPPVPTPPADHIITESSSDLLMESGVELTLES